MAASNQTIPGIRFLLKLDNTVFGAQSSATLSVPQEFRELVTKNNFGWVSNLSGRQEWSLSQDGFVLDQSGEAFIANGDAKFELDVGGSKVEVPSLDSIDLTLTQEIYERGGLDKELWRYIGFAEQKVEISTEGSYFDPESANGEVYNEIFNAKDNSNRISATFTLNGYEISGDVAPGDIEIESEPAGEDTTISATFMSDDEFTSGGTNLDSTLDGLFTAFFNRQFVDVALGHSEKNESTGTPNFVQDSTKYSGSGIVNTIELSATDGEEATLSFEVQGDGPLDRAAVS